MRGRLCNRIANFQGFAPAHATRTIVHNQFHPLRFPSWGLTCRVYCDSYRKAPEGFRTCGICSATVQPQLGCRPSSNEWGVGLKTHTRWRTVGVQLSSTFTPNNSERAEADNAFAVSMIASLCKIRHKEGDSCCPSTINQRIRESVRLCTGLPQFAREPHYSGQPWNGSHGRLT